MAEQTITKRVCDRPGCGATVTDKGGRFGFEDRGPVDLSTLLAEPVVMPVPDQIIKDATRALSVDLCRTCAESLRLWWTARQRRVD